MTKPAQVFSLAEILSDELQARGWKSEDAAVRMRTSHGAAKDLFFLDLILCIQDDGLLIDDETFDGLARAFDVDHQFFRNIHADWLQWPDRRSPFEPPESIFGPTSRRQAMIPITPP